MFSEEGAGANLATVASAAGVSRATLYRYYPNREALLEALVVYALTQAGDAWPMRVWSAPASKKRSSVSRGRWYRSAIGTRSSPVNRSSVIRPSRNA